MWQVTFPWEWINYKFESLLQRTSECLFYKLPLYSSCKPRFHYLRFSLVWLDILLNWYDVTPCTSKNVFRSSLLDKQHTQLEMHWLMVFKWDIRTISSVKFVFQYLNPSQSWCHDSFTGKQDYVFIFLFRKYVASPWLKRISFFSSPWKVLGIYFSLLPFPFCTSWLLKLKQFKK